MERIAIENLAQRKFNRCRWDIMKLSLGTGLTSALPTPTVEIPKQLGIAVGDLALCFHIYQIYFDDQIKDSKQFIDLVKRAGLVTAGGGAIVYIGYKAARGLLDEAANFAPPFGQIFSGVLTFSETITIGFLWLKFVNKLYIDEMTK